MRKLVQALLITLGCFSAAGVYAQEEGSESSEVATTEEGTTSQNRLFQQQEDDANEIGKN